jgi:hypothetical protein
MVDPRWVGHSVAMMLVVTSVDPDAARLAHTILVGRRRDMRSTG